MKQSSQHSGSERHADEGSAARSVSTLVPAAPKLIHLRDGELVLYRRPRSLLYQCRFKRPDGSWHRQSTGKASLEQAIRQACDIYDEARYRLRLGLAHRTHSIAHIAQLCVAELSRGSILSLKIGHKPFGSPCPEQLKPPPTDLITRLAPTLAGDE